MKVVLASTSPYRRELFARFGLPFSQLAPDVDECPLAGEPPSYLRKLESEAERVREVRWGPRTLDVDVVAVFAVGGEPVFSEHPDLLLPHPGAAGRATVLRPWLDVDPDAVLPGAGRVDALLAGLG